MAKFTGHTITPDSALGGIEIERSVRLWSQEGGAPNSGAVYFSRTGFGDSSTRTKATLSFWMKLTEDGYGHSLFVTGYSGSGGSQSDLIMTRNTSGYFVSENQNNSPLWRITSTTLLNDATGWYHFVISVDTTQGTDSDRVKIYINGVQDPNATQSHGWPSQNLETRFFKDNFRWGAADGNGNPSSNARVYFADIHGIDGTAYNATDFGYFESQTGLWKPKKFTGSYGSKGFHLEFKDNSSTTALAYDTSGNANHFTANNFSVASGISNDSMLDSPTNNWCIWNDHTEVSDITLSEGNLKAVSGADSWPAIYGTHGASSGKWYYEAVGADNTRWGVGWSTEDFKSGTSNTFSVGHFAYSQDPLTLYQDGSNVAINGTPAFTTGNVLQIATDIDNGKTWFGINNTWVNASNGSAGDPAAGTNPTITFSEKGQKHYPKMINNLGDVSVNFGQQGFTYTPPAGFQALNSKNLATVNAAGIINPQKHFDILIWDGDSSHNRNITGLEFKPDMVWIKSRNGGTYGGGLYYHHVIWDVLRGVGSDTVGASSRKELTVNENYQEGRGANYTDYYGHVSSFNRDGFQLDHVTGEPPLYVNRNTNTYVAWCWKAGGAGVSNSDGDITTTVSVNQEAGFSMFTYTGNGGNGQTVGHGLSKAPQWIIVKNRSNAQNWRVWHHKLAADGSKRLILDQTNVVEDASFLNDTAPTSTVFTLGPVDDAWNANGDNYISYCWHEVPGYSKFGSYTGNGSSDGVYVNTGFKPAWLLVKDTSTTENWRLFDNKRSPSNRLNKHLFPSNPNAESTETGLDFLSSGFKFRDGDAHQNGNGNVYVYMAFAEKPSGTMFGLDANAR